MIEVEDKVRECIRIWMRCTIGLVECGTCIARREERESESIRNLRGGRTRKMQEAGENRVEFSGEYGGGILHMEG